MTSQSTSTSSTPAKKPRRHPTSRGMRKHVREQKRLGFMENRERRKALREHIAWRDRNPNPAPKKKDSRGKGGGGIQRVRLSDLLFARTAQNLCPASGCGCLITGAYVTVVDQGSIQTVQVRRCSRCETLYRDFQAPTYAALPMATNQFNDCGYNCGWQSTSTAGHISSVSTADAGYQRLCTCGRCGKFYKPYVEPVRSGGSSGSGSWWGSGSL